MPDQKSYLTCRTWRFRKEKLRLWRKSARKFVLPIVVGLPIFAIALVAALWLADFAVMRFGWERTGLFLVAYLVGNICDQAKDVASRFKRTKQQQVDVWCDVRRALKEAWYDEHSAEFLYRSLKWGALTGAGYLLSEMLSSSVAMSGD